MKKLYLLLLISGILSFSLIALGQTKPLTKISSTQSDRNQLQTANSGSSIMLGYCDNEFVIGKGVMAPSEIQAAIYITPEQATLYKGNKIKSINVGLFNIAANLSVFIVKELEGKKLTEQAVGNGKIGWNKVDLNIPYTITGEGFYIGYKCTGSRPLAMSNKYSEHGAWFAVRAMDTGEWVWGNGATELGIKSWCLQALVEGENMPNDLNLWKLNRCSAKTGEDFILEGIVESLTTIPVTNYEIAYKINNGEAVSHTIQTSMNANELDTFRIKIPAINEAGKYPLQVSVAKVNGEDDAYAANNELEDLIYCRTDVFERTVVVEEGTGTWEKNAPMGIVGRREMEKKYPDSFIGIAVHVSDGMEAKVYKGLINDYFNAQYPNCVVDRKKEYVVEPSFENIEEIYLTERELTADAQIKITGLGFSPDSTTLHIDTESRFSYPETKADYRIAFVVLENGVTGHKQANTYAGGLKGEMGGFESLPETVAIEFDNVARGIYRDYIGTLNCFPTTIVDGEFYTYSYDLELPTNIQNKRNIDLAVLLIDGKSKEIMNADKLKIADDGNGIGQTQASPEIYIYSENGQIKVYGEYDAFQVYTTDGIEVPNSKLNSGIYIIKVTKGNHITVRKINK